MTTTKPTDTHDKSLNDRKVMKAYKSNKHWLRIIYKKHYNEYETFRGSLFKFQRRINSIYCSSVNSCNTLIIQWVSAKISFQQSNKIIDVCSHRNFKLTWILTGFENNSLILRFYPSSPW